MFGFIKNIIGTSILGDDQSFESSQNQNSRRDGSLTDIDSRDYYLENKKLTEFLQAEFPNYSQKRHLQYERRQAKDFEEIDISIYFDDKDKFIVSENNLKKVAFAEYTHLPKEDLPVEDVLMRVEVLEKYNKVIDQILQKSAAKHYDKFQEGIMNLDFFHTTSDSCLKNVKDTRNDINAMQNDLVKRSVKVIKLFKQKVRKQKAIKFLRRFKEKFGGIYKVINALDHEDFTNAYEIIPIIKNAKEEFETNADVARSFECLKNCEDYLDSKFDKLQAKVRTGIEVIFTDWNEKKFESYLKYYFMTEKCYPTIPTFLSQLEEILKTSVKVARDKAVSLYVYGTSLIPQIRSKIKQASEAAKQLSRDTYPKFISRVLYETSLVMYNIDVCCKYLEGKSREKMELVLEDKTTYQLSDYLTKIKKDLLKQRKVLWQVIQRKVSKLFLKQQICEFSYNDLITFLEYCNVFIEIGQDFSSSSSKVIRECVLHLLKEYYTVFHEKNMTSIRFFLSNERWRRLPLPPNYRDPKLVDLLTNFPDDYSNLSALFGTTKELPELENMTIEELMKKNSALSSFIKHNPFHIEEKPKIRRAMTTLLSAKNPDISIDEMNESDTTFVVNGSRIAEKINHVDVLQNGIETNEVVVCPSSDMIVKNFETYILLLNLLRPNALEIVTGLVTTFELYVYAVVTSFTLPKSVNDLLFSDINLDGISKIKEEEERMKSLEEFHELVLFQSSYKNIKTFLARLTDRFESYKLKLFIQADQSSSTNMLFHLGERIIATESILFIYNHLKYIQGILPVLINDPSELQTVSEYYQIYNRVIPDLREFIYFHYMPNFLRNNSIFQSIESVKWEVQEKPEYSNIYIERVVYFVKDLFERVECLAGGGIPKDVQNYIKMGILKAVFEQLTESYSRVKKINEQGREVMLADFKMIVDGLGSFINNQTSQQRENCEKYIKAWNTNIEELKDFVLNNQEKYTLRILNGLIQAHPGVKSLNKQQRKELLKEIEKRNLEFIRENM